MGNSAHPYQQWLLGYNKSPFEFTKSYYFAHLCDNINNIYQEGDEKIPLFIIIEELEKEERNNMESPLIRQFLIHLLKLVSDIPNQIDFFNYNDHLCQIMNNILEGKKLKSRLKLSDNFHFLKTEVKLYFFYLLQQKSHRKIKQLQPISVDSEDNQFHIVNGGQLYVQYGKSLNVKRLNGRNPKRTPTIDFELINMRPVKLLAETEEEWIGIANKMRNYGEIETSTIIIENLRMAREFMITNEEKAYIRQELDGKTMNSNVEKPIKSILKRIQRLQGERKCVRFRSILEEVRIYEEDEPDMTEEQNNFVERKRMPYSRKHKRCHYYPGCFKSEEMCIYAHPTEDCEDYKDSACNRGRDCPFKHGKCPVDRKCVEEYCIYEHYEQKHSRLRIQYNGNPLDAANHFEENFH